MMLFVFGQSGERMMLFVFGQSSDRKAILRNLHEKHHPFPARRPLGAKEDQDRGSRECFFHSVSPRIAKRSCGIYTKSIILSLQGARWALRKCIVKSIR